MIKSEKTENGGTITVLNGGITTVLRFTVSDSTSNPLVFRMECSGHDTRALSALIESLVMKYGSPVVFVRSENAQTRYAPSIANSVFRHSTRGNESLYTRPFPDGGVFSRLWTLAESMNEYRFLRSVEEELQVFDRYAVLGSLRRHMKPFEFMSVKEECDCTIQGSCVDTTRAVIQAARDAVSHTGSHAPAFRQVLDRMDRLQTDGSQSFDTKTSYILETIESIFLPAAVLLGHGNPFTQAVAAAFVGGAAKYTAVSEEFMGTYEDAFKYLSNKSNENDSKNQD